MQWHTGLRKDRDGGIAWQDAAQQCQDRCPAIGGALVGVVRNVVLAGQAACVPQMEYADQRGHHFRIIEVATAAFLGRADQMATVQTEVETVS